MLVGGSRAHQSYDLFKLIFEPRPQRPTSPAETEPPLNRSNEQIHSRPMRATSPFHQSSSLMFSSHLPLTTDELHGARNVFLIDVVLKRRTFVFFRKTAKL